MRPVITPGVPCLPHPSGKPHFHVSLNRSGGGIACEILHLKRILLEVIQNPRLILIAGVHIATGSNATPSIVGSVTSERAKNLKESRIRHTAFSAESNGSEIAALHV